MADESTFEIEISFRWWVLPYARALILFAIVFDIEPDEDKFWDLVERRGIWIR